MLAGWAAHRFNHFFTQLHWRRQRLWIPAENESKVDVKQFTCQQKKQAACCKHITLITVLLVIHPQAVISTSFSVYAFTLLFVCFVHMTTK